MYFDIEGSSVRLGGTLHWVPKGYPMAHWVHDAIEWARLIYLEHDEQESIQGRKAPAGSQPLPQRLPRSWPRILLKYAFDRVRMQHLASLRPFALTSEVLDPVPTDEGAEHLAIARSKETQPPGPQLKYLETAAQSYALAESVSDAVWDDAVNWALDNASSFRNVLETSYGAWVDGDVEEVDRINSLHTRARFAPIKHAVITERNCLWLPTIRDLAESADEPTLVLVGAAHLGGADGLLSQLAAGGFGLTAAARQ
jgi:uncharacterized protein YbaP (TraB family)